jgi:hypothetical protein
VFIHSINAIGPAPICTCIYPDFCTSTLLCCWQRCHLPLTASWICASLLSICSRIGSCLAAAGPAARAVASSLRNSRCAASALRSSAGSSSGGKTRERHSQTVRVRSCEFIVFDAAQQAPCAALQQAAAVKGLTARTQRDTVRPCVCTILDALSLALHRSCPVQIHSSSGELTAAAAAAAAGMQALRREPWGDVDCAAGVDLQGSSSSE